MTPQKTRVRGYSVRPVYFRCRPQNLRLGLEPCVTYVCVSGVVPEPLSLSCVIREFQVWFQNLCLRPDPCVSGVVPEPAHQVAEEARGGNGDGKEEARAGGGHGEHLGPGRRLHQ